jgi:hypothetical protein
MTTTTSHATMSPTLTSNSSYSTLPSLKHRLALSSKQSVITADASAADTASKTAENGISNNNSSNHMNFLNANSDVLANLVKLYGVSKRNSLMKWCQVKLSLLFFVFFFYLPYLQ